MSRVIDVSQLPPPQAIRPLSYDGIKAARLVALTAAMQAAGIDFDVSSLETDSAVILQEVDGYREFLDKGAINDAVRAVLPAFARGTDLDAIAARANVERLVIRAADPANGVAELRESDAQLLDRYLSGFSAPAAGSEDGYIFRAATAWPGRHDIAAVHGGAGKVLVYLLSPDGVETPLAVVLRVALALQRKDARGLTDDVSVRAATVDRYHIGLKLMVPRGPDASLVRGQAEASVRAFSRERYFIGAEVPANAIAAAAYVPNVSRVVATLPIADLPARVGVAPWLETLNVTTEVVG